MAVLLGISGCSNGGYAHVELGDVHLEEVPAGSWLSLFEIDYSPGAKRIKAQVLDQLHARGSLIDKYVREDGANTVNSFLWDVEGRKIREEYYEGGIWMGPEIVPYQEYYNGGLSGWITIEFEQGIPYSKLLPDHHSEIHDRGLEHAATIMSSIDQGRRLFLFGHGSLCRKISFF